LPSSAAGNNRSPSTPEVAAAACQHAVAISLHRDAEAAFEALQQAANLLLAAEENSIDWRSVFSSFAHATGHILSVVKTGCPPTHQQDGSVWHAPTREMFSGRNTALAGCYHPRKKAHLALFLGDLARQLGHDIAADAWFLRAQTLAQTSGDWKMAALSVMARATVFVIAHQWDEALMALRRAFRTLRVCRLEEGAGRDSARAGFDLDAAVLALSSDVLRDIEGEVAGMIIIPGVLNVLRNGEHAAVEGRVVADACRRMATDSPATQLWGNLASLLEAAFVNEESRTALLARTRSNGVHFAVEIVGRFLAARVGVINEAFADQLPVMPQLTSAFSPRSAEYRQILLPYIQQFWTDRLTEEAFRLSGPVLVRAAFEAACAGPPDQRVRAIFAAVRGGLSISRMPDDIQRWLRG